ncbi:hemoglobin [Culex quinquefasciatus]|uniref:Hemoglobin n=1 Tax=Culex quinquefasciatus TaxID=7176 RepID=B0WEP8_CULQU|nr:hemoglobin [Culex quinquefasciatus]|eukprot:XP_001847182.1 hemoglobin [Culex quinquefasciatus]
MEGVVPPLRHEISKNGPRIRDQGQKLPLRTKFHANRRGAGATAVLFEEHPKYLEYFDFSQDDSAEELRENKSLHAHALNVMHLIDCLWHNHGILPGSTGSTWLYNSRRSFFIFYEEYC